MLATQQTEGNLSREGKGTMSSNIKSSPASTPDTDISYGASDAAQPMRNEATVSDPGTNAPHAAPLVRRASARAAARRRYHDDCPQRRAVTGRDRTDFRERSPRRGTGRPGPRGARNQRHICRTHRRAAGEADRPAGDLQRRVVGESGRPVPAPEPQLRRLPPGVRRDVRTALQGGIAVLVRARRRRLLRGDVRSQQRRPVPAAQPRHQRPGHRVRPSVAEGLPARRAGLVRAQRQGLLQRHLESEHRRPVPAPGPHLTTSSSPSTARCTATTSSWQH